jgi:RND family efflux transporter MFP subunit
MNHSIRTQPDTEVAPTLPEPPETRESQPQSHRKWLAAVAVLVLFAGVLGYGIFIRVRQGTTVEAETTNMATTTVSVVSPTGASSTQELVLPGNVQPFITAPIYSRTNGYLQKWFFDIGARVKKGQLMAIIDTPEVDQQLEQSRSTLSVAQANLKLAEITMTRYKGLLSTHAVAQQDVDNAVGTYNANKAIVEADRANVKQLETLQSFERIYAPFDGIVVVRNIDIGDLINSGSSGGVKTDLFRIAQADKLRVYVTVPEQYSQGVTEGLGADLRLAEFPGRQFPGKVVRTADAINPTTRTLLTEVQVDNPTGRLFSGSYAEVHLKAPIKIPTYTLPVSTLLFRKEGLQVAVARDGKALLVPITPGHDFGDHIEVISGLQGNEAVIDNPPDSIVSGDKIQIVQKPAGGAKK